MATVSEIITNDKVKKGWQVIIKEAEDGSVNFIYDGSVDRYKLIGLLEVEVEVLKKELKDNVKK